MQRKTTRFKGEVLLAALLAVGSSLPLGAQEWDLAPTPVRDRFVAPFMEGWYDNGDGTYTISFGYLNANLDRAVEIPIGERNRIEPEEFDGLQPTVFHESRRRGVFAITIPEEMRDTDIWWTLTNDDGEVYRVPGRARSVSYQLDWYPRAHGSEPPLLWFESEDRVGRGPAGIFAERALEVRVGQPVTLEAHVRDESERDPNDPRFREGVPVRVVWWKHQGPPGEVTFTRHASNPMPDRPAPGRFTGLQGPVESESLPQVIQLEGTEGAARVDAVFPAPGTYVMRVTADNWGAPDSTANDQCCWTNGYVRVNVSP
jgi:hypothetical protein